jgi:hypothetical protein
MNAISPTDAMAQSKFFLQLIDPMATEFCFRTFDDKKGTERTSLLSKRDGTVGQHTANLRELNDAEAGIYVVVNEGGQTDNDITCVRAVFADIDNVDIPYEPIAEALSPHCVIESSPGKHHIYWFVPDDFPLDQFKPIQQAIAAKYGTDPSVCNLSRVMRLPGFKHNKSDPFDVQIVKYNKDMPRYSIDEIINGLGLTIGQKQLPPKQTNSAGTSALSQAITSGIYMEPSIVSEGGRNAALMAYQGHLRGSGEYEDVVIDKIREFNVTKCRPPLEDDEVDKVLSRYPEQANIRPSEIPKDDWPDPQEIKAALSEVPEFGLDLLPDVFKPLVADASELMQAPPDFIAVPLMVAAAAALGNDWEIAPKGLDRSWKVTPVLWGGIVGRPGTKKSPCMDKAITPLMEIEKRLGNDHVLKLQKYQTDKHIYDALVKKLKASSGGASPSLLPPRPEEPQPERLVVNDTSYQKLGEIHHWSPRGLIVCRDELVGLLEDVEDKGQEGAKAFYLAAWNGNQTHSVDRVTRDRNVIERLAISVLGGIQPGKLQNYVRKATYGGSGDDGLMQRFQLLVWPDVSEEWKLIDRYHDQQAVDDVLAAFLRLRDLKPTDVNALTSPLGGPSYLKFDEQAQAHFNVAWKGFEQMARSGACHAALEAHFSKYPRMVAALSLVIHLVDGGVGPVNLKATQKAVNWAKYLALHAKRIYGAVDNASAQSAKALAEKIKEGILQSGFTARFVQRKGWQYLSTKDDVAAAIVWLIDTDWLIAEEIKGKGTLTKVYIINPRARE